MTFDFLVGMYKGVIKKIIDDKEPEKNNTNKGNESYYKCEKCITACTNLCNCRCHIMSCNDCDNINCNINTCKCECHIDKNNSQVDNKNSNYNNANSMHTIRNQHPPAFDSPTRQPSIKFVDDISPRRKITNNKNTLSTFPDNLAMSSNSKTGNKSVPYNDSNNSNYNQGVSNIPKRSVSQINATNNKMNYNQITKSNEYSQNNLIENNKINNSVNSPIKKIFKRSLQNENSVLDESLNIRGSNFSVNSQFLNNKSENYNVGQVNSYDIYISSFTNDLTPEEILKMETKIMKEKQNLKEVQTNKKKTSSKYSTIVHDEEEKSKSELRDPQNNISEQKNIASMILKKKNEEKGVIKWKSKSKKKNDAADKFENDDYTINNKSNLSNCLQQQFNMAHINIRNPDKLDHHREEKFIRDKSQIAIEASHLNNEIKHEKTNDKKKLASSIFEAVENQASWQSYTTLLVADAEVDKERDLAKTNNPNFTVTSDAKKNK